MWWHMWCNQLDCSDYSDYCFSWIITTHLPCNIFYINVISKSLLKEYFSHNMKLLSKQQIQWTIIISHYGDVIMGTIASQTTSLMIVYSTIYSDADQRKYQSSASLAFARGIHWALVNSPYKWPVRRKMFPFDDVIMNRLAQDWGNFNCQCIGVTIVSHHAIDLCNLVFNFPTNNIQNWLTSCIQHLCSPLPALQYLPISLVGDIYLRPLSYQQHLACLHAHCWNLMLSTNYCCKGQAQQLDRSWSVITCSIKKNKSDVKRRNTPRPPRSVYHTK